MLFKVSSVSAPSGDEAVLLSGFVAAVVLLGIGRGVEVSGLPTVLLGVCNERRDKYAERFSLRNTSRHLYKPEFEWSGKDWLFNARTLSTREKYPP